MVNDNAKGSAKIESLTSEGNKDGSTSVLFWLPKDTLKKIEANAKKIGLSVQGWLGQVIEEIMKSV